MNNIYEGQYTSFIYELIKDQNYEEAIKVLNEQLSTNPRSRAALSLLGYCNYMIGDYTMAAIYYEQLNKYFPEVAEYRFYLAQSLYKADNYEESLKACQNIEKPELVHQTTILQFANKYQMNDMTNVHNVLSSADQDKQETLVCHGCIAYKEGKYEDAKEKFEEARKMGESSDILYNIGVSSYKMKKPSIAVEMFQEILKYVANNYPEVIVPTNIEGFRPTKISNSPLLYESCIIEAYNLKAAIDYMLDNIQEAKEALNELPPRDEEDLDSVTLHNLALVNIDLDPDDSFKKLNFLLKNPPCPPEALANLLILYCKYEQYDLAHDVLSENEELKLKYLTEDEITYISALSMMKTSKEAAFDSLEKLSKLYRDNISKQFKLIKDAKNSADKTLFNKILNNYEAALQKYLPVITTQAKIYWDSGDYQIVEQILKAPDTQEIYSENKTWKINIGHSYFIQETKFKEAIQYYMDVFDNTQDLLTLPASVIANLCVSLIMIQKNEEAQDIIRRIEEEENKALEIDPERQLFHTCIVNLIVGTLYCAKNNFEFGIGRIMEALRNVNKKINMDTWFYAKRCFLSLIESLSKQVLVIPDRLYLELIHFLDNADRLGKNITTQIVDNNQNEGHESYTVSSEARLLKRLLLKLRDNIDYS